MSEKTQNFTQSLDAAIRENPVSAALVGMGLLWMFVGRDRIAAAASLIPAAGRAGADAASKVAGGVSSSVNGAVERMPSMGDVSKPAGDLAAAVKDQTKGLSDGASTVIEAGRGQMAELFERQPLLLGAVGLAIGAGVGASFATTASENELFGEAAETVKTAVSETVGERAEALQEEAARQGLSPEKARDGLRTLADNLTDAASSALSR